jgi:hypothetical protein
VHVLPVCLLAGIAAWMNLGALHQFQHADSLLLVLVSIQHWTPFYWGQDRFGMIVPLVTRAVRDPLWNMLAQGYLTTFAALVAPLLIARMLIDQPRVWILVGLLTNVLLLLFVPAVVQFDWFVNQPYSLALALGCGGLLLVNGDDTRRIAVGTILVFFAHWVDIAVCVQLIPLVVLRGDWTGRRLGAIGAGAAGGLLLAHTISAPHTTASVTPLAQWPHAWTQLLLTAFGIILHPTALAFFALALVALFVGRLKSGRSVLVAPCAIATAVAVANWLAMGTSEWVRLNLYFARYMFPTLLLLGVAASTVLAEYSFRRQVAWLAAAGVALLALAVSIYGWPSAAAIASGLDQRNGRLTADVIESHATVIGGEYWAVWPAVFHANLIQYRRTRRADIFGLTYRGDQTSPLWLGRPETIAAAATADHEMERYADRLGLSIEPLAHRASIDLFTLRPK